VIPCFFQEHGIVFEQTDSSVAAIAQQPSDDPCFMVVIYTQTEWSSVVLFSTRPLYVSFVCTTQAAASILLDE
jgi:hypothetical protein